MNDYEERQRHDKLSRGINFANKITFNGELSFHGRVISNNEVASIDRDMQEDLQNGTILNWCRNADKLYPVRTKSDGNCLCHSVCKFIWGIGDDKLMLRHLVYVSIDSETNRDRWQLHYENQTRLNNRHSMELSGTEWNREWKHVIDTASPATTQTTAVPYHHLEAIHIFSLANILRRPIIVLADSTARTLSGTSLQESDIGGIYLPLNWPAAECHKFPIFLGYTMSHFCPLLPMETPGQSLFTVPIVFKNGSSLPVRFLTAPEERSAAHLLKTYLKIKEVALSSSDTLSLVLSTEVKTMPMENIATSFQTSPPPPTNQSQAFSAATVASSDFNMVPCVKPGCPYFGNATTGNMCSSCLKDFLQTETQRHEMRQTFPQRNKTELNRLSEPTAPPPSMPISENFIDLSMMGQQCQTGCGFRCSVNTFPFCHECVGRQESTAAKQTNITDESLFGAGVGAVGGTETTGRARQETPERMETSGMETSRTETTRMETSGTETSGGRCRGEGCDRSGRSHLQGICDKCYMDETWRKKHICASPGCEGLRVTREEYCDPCSSRQTGFASNQPNKFLDNQQTRLAQSSHGLSFGQHMQQSEVGQATKNFAEDIEQTGFIQNSQRDAFGKFNNGRGFGESSQQSCVPTEKRKEAVSVEETAYSEKMEQTGVSDHESSSSLIASGSQCNAGSYSPPVVTGSQDKIKCASPMCDMMIYPPNKLCDKCINILMKSQASIAASEQQSTTNSGELSRSGRSNSTPIAVRQHGIHLSLQETTRPNSAPIGRKCLTPGCTRFGDQSTADLCTRCFKNALSPENSVPSVPAPTNNTDPFNAMMSRVENNRRNPQQCKRAGCTNYGSPNKEGFCNSCYPIYLASVAMM